MRFVGCWLALLLFSYIFYCPFVRANDLKNSCPTCKTIVENFEKGLDRTSKKNFGGGNTAWEERKLSKYETSEIRLVEILENLCDSSNFECNHMVEEYEDHFENWWFKKKQKYPDLFKWFCIDTIKVCCPKGTFGPDCNACIGGSESPCNGNGKCKGDGTRTGDGKCSCDKEYEGDLCLECADGYYSKERNDTFSLCTECHESCKTCTGPTNKDCKECKNGWLKNNVEECNDVDECANESSPCTESQYCLNSPGSYTCKACDEACDTCTGEGPDQCKACASGYTLEDSKCTDINECDNSEEKVCSRENEECVNTKGSFKCFCAVGFEDQEGVCVETKQTDDHSKNESLDSETTKVLESTHQDL
ncbi:cysteine-rich with EGF-like domain protein 2 [Erpetoichthys calabaricus]|uniref:Cysteine-rich with EGF-like domains 2 n=1 Tax=Erpetoichthys calabaricus TaxID=27687 RepID=A0A8C4RT55_ERPCA|nr:cysteine-rich with EGF-like domain protein 2 [Erpetoichthys calabaricus]